MRYRHTDMSGFGEGKRPSGSRYGKPKQRRRRTPEEIRASKERRAAKYAALPLNEQFAKAYGWGVDYLAEAPRTAHQIKDRLMSRGAPEEVAEAVVDRLAELGYVNDEQFAESWVRSRQRSRGLAKGAIKRELITKGIDKETADAAVEDVADEDEYERAKTLALKKVKSMRGLDKQVATRRLVGMLGRKGYPPGIAFAVVKDVLSIDSDEATPVDD